MFAYFKRILGTAALPVQAATDNARPEEPKPAVGDRTLTPASWPGTEQRPTPLAWGGGCCG